MDTNKIVLLFVGFLITSTFSSYFATTISNNNSSIKSNERQLVNTKDIEVLKADFRLMGNKVIELEKNYLLLNEQVLSLRNEVSKSREENRANFKILHENQAHIIPVVDQAMEYFVETGGGKLLKK
jgi:hypothetical protein